MTKMKFGEFLKIFYPNSSISKHSLDFFPEKCHAGKYNRQYNSRALRRNEHIKIIDRNMKFTERRKKQSLMMGKSRAILYHITLKWRTQIAEHLPKLTQ